MRQTILGLSALLALPIALLVLFTLVSSPTAQIQAGGPVPKIQADCDLVGLAGQVCIETNSSAENPDIFIGNGGRGVRIMTTDVVTSNDLNAVATIGPRYSGAVSEATAIQIDNGASTPMGYRIYTHPTFGPEMTAFWGTTLLSDSVRVFQGSPGGIVLDNNGVRDNCFLWDDTGKVTMYNVESCRWRISGQAAVRATDGTNCSAVSAVELRSGNGAQNVVRCATSDSGFIYLSPIKPPVTWQTGTLASLTIPVVSKNAAPSGHVDLEPSVVCKRSGTDTLETTWAASASVANVTLATQYRVEYISWSDIPTNGTCNSGALIEIRLRVEADSTANGMGTTGDVAILADSIGFSLYQGTSR